MVTATRSRRRASTQYVAMGLSPSMVDLLVEELEEEGAIPLRVENDDDGAALVFFQITGGDSGASLTRLSQRFGCGFAPAAGR
jgi:hypothetical protein